MAQFKVGDRVIVNDVQYDGAPGEIVDTNDNGPYDWRVRMDTINGNSGYRWPVKEREIKHEESEVSKPQIGDRVVVRDDTGNSGLNGILESGIGSFPYQVNFGNGSPHPVYENEVEPFVEDEEADFVDDEFEDDDTPPPIHPGYAGEPYVEGYDEMAAVVEDKTQIDGTTSIEARLIDFKPIDPSTLEWPNTSETRAENALDTQVGGDHYNDLEIQPVIYNHANRLGFIEGSIVKYISRWRNKNGVEDLEKIKHYVDMLIELEETKACLDLK